VPWLALSRLFGYPKGDFDKSLNLKFKYFSKYIDRSNKPSVYGAVKNEDLDVVP
jgi:hypothetical protein